MIINPFYKNPKYFGIVTSLVTFILIFLLYTVIKYEESIKEDMFIIGTEDVLTITNNKAKQISSLFRNKDNYINQIKSDKDLQNKIEISLAELLTKNIKYSYVLYKDKNNIFRFLVDASNEEDKAMVNQKFDVDSSKWFDLYLQKKPIIINHSILQKLSISYLVPILNQNEVELILVIDFSIKKVENINKIMDLMKNGLLIMLLIIIIFFMIFVIQIIRYKKIKKSSSTDKLTNVYNRNHLHEIQDKIALREYIIAALDIDYFKRINDSYGHDAGDIVLKEIGNIMLHTIRDNDDIVIRYGGEEFLIFIKHHNNKTKAMSVIKRIFENIKEYKMFITQEEYINITVSIGVNLIPNNSKNFMEAFKLADKALYEVKHNGRDGIKIYNDVNLKS